jgi:hypothetical protein
VSILFIGHFGVAFALKKADKNISLGSLFLAVQFADILWASLVLLGVEKAAIVPGITAASPLDLTYYPFSHSPVFSLLWGGAAYITYRMISMRRGLRDNKAATIIGLAVMSHFLLDFITHRPDLPLFINSLGTYKIGLGLWNYLIPSIVVENLIFVGGLMVYLKSTKGTTVLGKYGMISLSIFLLIMNASSYFTPLNLVTLVTSNLVINLFAVGLVFWLDPKRI